MYVHYEQKEKRKEKNDGGCDHRVLVPILPSMVLVWTVFGHSWPVGILEGVDQVESPLMMGHT